MTLLTGGARKGEICKIRRDHIDWGSMVLQIVGTKTEGRSAGTTVRPVEIMDSIAEILRERLAVIPKDQQYIFTRSGGEVTHYYEILRAACGATGVLYGRNVVGGLVTHDTRHTAATRMLQAGHDLATVGSVLGHTDRTMTMNYSHANRETVHKAMQVVEEFAGTGTLGKASK
jgi:integrase